ncbi:MAG: metal-dependent hydrolase, partial [Halobacteria archaeon]|nr:metal-dependent hydrolase [Halobacteria archaeon]
MAFSGVAAAAHYLGYTKRRALALGVFAGAFALIPDVDILYAFLGAFSGFDGVWGTVDAFWESSTVTHRAATHSLVVGGISAVGFYLVARTLISFEYEEESSVLHSLGGAALLGGLTVVVLVSSGPVVTATFVVFALAGVLLTAAGVSLNGISGTQLVSLTRRELLAVASAGLLSHPFGDLFTGKPP